MRRTVKKSGIVLSTLLRRTNWPYHQNIISGHIFSKVISLGSTLYCCGGGGYTGCCAHSCMHNYPITSIPKFINDFLFCFYKLFGDVLLYREEEKYYLFLCGFPNHGRSWTICESIILPCTQAILSNSPVRDNPSKNCRDILESFHFLL